MRAAQSAVANAARFMDFSPREANPRRCTLHAARGVPLFYGPTPSGGETMRARRLTALCAAGVLCVHAGALLAQAYPTKAVRMVIAAAPGGSTDVLGRVFAQRLSERMGQPFVPENRGGGGGAVAAEYVAKSTPDGYTILMSNDQLVISAAAGAKVPYDPFKDFTPIAVMARGPVVLGVHPAFPAKSVPELIALAKANRGKYAFSSCGNGTVLHLAGELLNLQAGIDLVHVPYRGCAPAMTDAVAGQVPIFFTVLGNAAAFERNGKVRLLGVHTT